jgi:hypothetical protein
VGGAAAQGALPGSSTPMSRGPLTCASLGCSNVVWVLWNRIFQRSRAWDCIHDFLPAEQALVAGWEPVFLASILLATVGAAAGAGEGAPTPSALYLGFVRGAGETRALPPVCQGT